VETAEPGAGWLPPNVDQLDVLDSAGVGAWRWYRASGVVVWNAQLERLYGIGPGEFGGTFEDWIGLVHPEDAGAVIGQLDVAVEARSELRFDHRCVWPDGSVHWIESRGSIVFDDAGEVVGGAGIALGIDARRALEQSRAQTARRLLEIQQLTAALSRTATTRDISNALRERGVSALDADWAFLALAEELGSGPADLHPPESARVRHARRALDRGEPVRFDSHDDMHSLDADDIAAASIYVPLFAGSVPFAVLGFGFDRSHRVAADDIELIRALWRLGGQALQRAQLLDDAERSIYRSARLQEVTARFAAAVTLDDVAAAVVDSILPAVGAQAGEVSSYDRETNTARFLAFHGYASPVERQESFRTLSLDPPSATRDVLLSGEPCFIETSDEWQARYPEFADDLLATGVQATYVLPLIVDGATIGTVGMSFTVPRRVTGDDKQFLAVAAGLCAQTLARTQAYAAERASAERLARIQDIADSALTNLSLEELLDDLPARVARGLDCDFVRILLLDDAGETLLERGRYGFTSGSRTATIPLGRGLSGGVFTSGMPMVADDLSTVEIFNEELRESAKSAIGVPLSSAGEIIGVLDGSTRETRHFRHDDVQFLSLAADRIATAIERSNVFAIERAARERSEYLDRIGETLTRANGIDELLAAITNAAVPRLADWCAVVVVDADPSVAPHRVIAHGDPAKRDLVRTLELRFTYDPDAPFGAASVIRTGRPEFYPAITRAMAAESGNPELEALVRELSIESAIIVPLRGRDRTFGALQLVQAESGRRYGQADVALAFDVAGRIGAALDNVMLYERQRRVAETLQRSLLPERFPDIPGIEIAARYMPATEGIDVGGDFFDIVQADEDHWSLVIGDVSGKGVDAAAFTAVARHTARAAARHGMSPAGVLMWVNDAFAIGPNPHGDFCTALAVSLSPRDGYHGLEIAAGGHPLPVLVSNGNARFVGTHGSLLGVVADPRFVEDEAALRPGDWLVLYTDGVTDEPGPAALGDAELLELIEQTVLTQQTAHASAEDAAERLEKALLLRCANVRRDDIALLLVRALTDG
jgi:serine phosphatase RsbU (regulator of sigma subunit)/transcriptional regulator with GAF, ATPase, and Fis domain